MDSLIAREISASSFPSLTKFFVLKDKTESSKLWKDLVPRQRDEDCFESYFSHCELYGLLLSSHRTFLSQELLCQCVFCKESSSSWFDCRLCDFDPALVGRSESEFWETCVDKDVCVSLDYLINSSNHSGRSRRRFFCISIVIVLFILFLIFSTSLSGCFFITSLCFWTCGWRVLQWWCWRRTCTGTGGYPWNNRRNEVIRFCI